MRLDQATLAVLSGAIIDGRALRITEQLERPLYVKVNKALEAAGGKWSRTAKAHLFTDDIGTLIDDLCVTGEIGTKQDKQQFFTPPALAERVVKLAEIEQGMTILEPSAGDGALLRALPGLAPWSFTCRQTIGTVVAIEQDPVMCEKIKDQGLAHVIECRDFLTRDLIAPGSVDRVLMNPPFARQKDIDHVMHAHQGFLKPSGLLVAIMSAGVTFRQDQKARRFRGLVEDYGGTIEPLPEGSFKESGTMVNTVIARIPG